MNDEKKLKPRIVAVGRDRPFPIRLMPDGSIEMDETDMALKCNQKNIDYHKYVEGLSLTRRNFGGKPPELT